MKTIAMLLAFGTAGFAGCASVVPPESAGIAIIPVRSASVGVLRLQLARNNGQLVLQGAVYRRLEADTTARTHLDVVFLDSSGQRLREEIVHFEPAALRRAPRPPAGRRGYRMPIPALPIGTAKIEVRAHDGEHAGNG